MSASGLHRITRAKMFTRKDTPQQERTDSLKNTQNLATHRTTCQVLSEEPSKSTTAGGCGLALTRPETEVSDLLLDS